MARTYTSGEITTIVLLAILAILVVIMGVQTWKRSRIPLAELERRRRRILAATGKLGDANLVDIRGTVIYYSYDVRGVGYTAAQDVSTLSEQMPADLSAAVGPIYVKYDPGNPANSIVVSEEWNGLRILYPHP